jgi:hypothetical protein
MPDALYKHSDMQNCHESQSTCVKSGTKPAAAAAAADNAASTPDVVADVCVLAFVNDSP